MSLIAPLINERFLIRIFKYWEGRSDREWVNNYHASCVEDTTIGALESIGEAIANFEQELHDTRVTFTRYVVSTYLPDSDPYDGNEFFVRGLSFVGVREPGLLGDILPLTDVRFVRFLPAMGRSSNLAYRGSIYEGEVNAASGEREFDDVSTQAALVDAAFSGHLADYVGGGTADIHLASGSVALRPIVAVESFKPGHVPTKHKYFDVGPTAPGPGDP